MKKQMEEKAQILITMSKKRKELIEKLARELSYKENRFINSQTLIMEVVNEKYFKNEV